jgi:tRNA (guanine6-N2)-methyltransferase
MARSRSRRSSTRPRSTPLEFAASVHPGLEEICGKEIEARLAGAQVIDSQRGWVIFVYPGDAADTLPLRTTEDVFVLLFRTTTLPPERKRALALLTHVGRNSRYWDQAWSQVRQTRRPVKRVTFRVIAQMTGRHPFRRQEVRDAVLTGVQMRWPGWKPVADDAHLEVWSPVIDNWAAIALRLSDRKMRHRTYKEEHRPASLRPTLAAAMVALSRPRHDDRFCDPMCGTGTILAERALYGPSQRLLGGDIDPDALDAAGVNLAQVGETRGQRILHLWDAGALPLRTASLDAVVTNLPFGKQIGSQPANVALYERFLQELARTLRPGGRAVLLTSEKELMHDLMRRHTHLHREREVLVGVLGQAARIYVLRKA